MLRRFGYGFEKKSADSPSIQHARAFFLDLLPQVRETIIPTLFDAAYQPFFEFLTNNQDEILSIRERIEQRSGETTTPIPDDLSEVAVNIFLFSWHALQRRRGAGVLCRALQRWSNAWNLPDEWCLEHALKALRWQYRVSRGSGSFDTHGAHGAWRDACIELEMESVFEFLPFYEELEGRELQIFHFEYEGIDFIVRGPFDKSVPDFKREVERKFESLGGQKVRGARKELEDSLRIYLDEVAKVATEMDLKESPIRRASQAHFGWLIEFLVPPVPSGPTKKLEEVAAIYNQPKQTISDGINRAAELLGIKKLRRHKPGPKQGQTWRRELSKRESDNKDARLRRTVNAIATVENPESNKELAQEIGISPSHFGRG